MARRDAENIISKLRQMSEEGLGSVMGELMANERMRKGLGRAGERLMANKHVFDRNVETVLDFVNIPSKRDIRELKSRLDTLSSQLVNLSMKIDRMLAADETPRAAPRSRAADPASSSKQYGQSGRSAAPGPRPVPRRRKGRSNCSNPKQTLDCVRAGLRPRRLRTHSQHRETPPQPGEIGKFGRLASEVGHREQLQSRRSARAQRRYRGGLALMQRGELLGRAHEFAP